MDIEQGNKLIAEFMGGKLKHQIISAIGDRMQNDDIWLPFHGIRIIKELKYHSSWDWLMPVVKKIENIEVRGMYTVIIKQQYCSIVFQDETDTLLYETTAQESSSKIDAVWQTVVKFIQTKNENTSSLQS